MLIAKESAELKVLSDGFETIKNKRAVPRTIVSPPILTKIEFNDGTSIDGYVFDISQKGLSFYSVDKNKKENCCHNGLRGRVEFEKEIHGIKKMDFEIIHRSTPKFGTCFYGAKRID